MQISDFAKYKTSRIVYICNNLKTYIHGEAHR